MRYQPLGGSSVDISAIGLGCMTMAGVYGKADDAESIKAIHHALDRGINFFDTADVYGNGSNEKLLGRALRDCRSKAVIGTKFGNVRMPDGSKGADGRPEYAVESCHRSLKRLGVDCLDLFYLHRVDPTVPIEESIGAMARLVDQGKVKHLGLSEAGADTLRRAYRTHPISALQTEYSLWSREVETEILPTCRELGVTFVAYSPLCRGLLTGNIRGPQDLVENDRRVDLPRFCNGNIERNALLLADLDDLAAEKGYTQSQIALAWVLAQGDGIVPIPGTKKIAHIDQLVEALEIDLSDADLQRLDQAFGTNVPYGTRYPKRQLSTLGL